MSKFTNYVVEGEPDNANEAILALIDYMKKRKMNINPLPKINYVDDKENAEELLGDTGNYDHTNQTINIYTRDRHPEDILRSFCHEMIHHMQNVEGRLKQLGTNNINKSSELKKLESEANEKGTMIFRAWKDKTLKRN